MVGCGVGFSGEGGVEGDADGGGGACGCGEEVSAFHERNVVVRRGERGFLMDCCVGCWIWLETGRFFADGAAFVLLLLSGLGFDGGVVGDAAEDGDVAIGLRGELWAFHVGFAVVVAAEDFALGIDDDVGVDARDGHEEDVHAVFAVDGDLWVGDHDGGAEGEGGDVGFGLVVDEAGVEVGVLGIA